MTTKIPFSILICGVSTATPLFLATRLTATSDILLYRASSALPSFPDPMAFARNSAVPTSLPALFRCAGNSPPIDERTLAADS